ncbi:hypothetical protein [Gemmatimonas sp.]
MNARIRRGTSLVELLVALPLAVLAASAAALLLLRIARPARAQSAALSVSRELRHARMVLAADLEPIGGRDLHIVTDSLLEFTGQLGVAAVCRVASARAIDVAVPPQSGDQWLGAVRAGDGVRGWLLPAHPAMPPERVVRVLASDPVGIGPGTCGADSVSLSAIWRFTFLDSALHRQLGTIVSVHRDVRFRHYSSGGQWWMGRQSRIGGQWEGLQPVAGPLVAPAQRGLGVQARDAQGQAEAISSATPDSIRARAIGLAIDIRMRRRVREGWAPAADSVEISVPLRATSFRRTP